MLTTVSTNSTEHIIFYGKMLKAFLLQLGIEQGYPLSPPPLMIALRVLARKINTSHMVLKGRNRNYFFQMRGLYMNNNYKKNQINH
jgi:hypothetical protein